jgi:uncharacterized protein (TIGR03086 family)
MGEGADRYRRIADQFAARVDAVPHGAWDQPAPCEGWVARDVVRHLVEWVPGFFRSYAGVDLGAMPSVDSDPAGAWAALDLALRSLLDDPVIASQEFDAPPGRTTVEDAVDMFCAGDLLVHTWDVARATGLDERLDADEVHRMFAAMQPIDEMLRASGHYGPRVPVPDDADEQTKLIAFTGRQP